MGIEFARWSTNTEGWAAQGPRSEILPPRAGAPAARAVPAVTRTTDWTPERIAALSEPEVRQLMANAERLEDRAIAARCAKVLKERPLRSAPAGARARPAKDGPRLVSRNTAFALRGAFLADRSASRSGVTRRGEVIFALWAADIRQDAAGGSHLLWAPNVEGSRPWSDTPAGRERREHCRRALKNGTALGLLVHGERLQDALPDEKAARIDGIDPGSAQPLRVEQRGEEFWAVWPRGAGAL